MGVKIKILTVIISRPQRSLASTKLSRRALRSTDYGVTIPDLPGCFSAGVRVDDALTEVVEAIELQLDGMLQDNEPLPILQTIEIHQ